MPMTEAQISAINSRALALEGGDLQTLINAVRYGSGGEASSIPRAINPNTQRAIGWWKTFDWETGAWADLQGGSGGGSGPDLISTITWMADIDDEPDARERAANGLRDWLDKLPGQSPARQEVGFRPLSLGDDSPRPGHRSLRR